MSKVYMPPDRKLPVATKESKKMAWLVIQESYHGDEDGKWTDLFPGDIPSWVTEEDCLSKMMEGKMVCADPDNGAKWYRAVQVQRPTEH